jgi:hypothetical protein
MMLGLPLGVSLARYWGIVIRPLEVNVQVPAGPV